MRFVSDRDVGLGPLGGLATALHETTADAVLITACDMPLLSQPLLQWLLQQRQTAGATTDVSVVVHNAQREPLCAIYHRRVLPLLARRLRQQQRSLHGLLAGVSVAECQIPTAMSAGLANCNTPSEYRSPNISATVCFIL